MLVLEPEAAAMFCQQEILHEPNLDHMGSEITSHYLMVDCGGRTVDITAHKLTKTSDGEILIEEVYQAHTNTCGGFRVNIEFEKMLEKLFQLTEEGIREFKSKFPWKWMKQIYKEFESLKCRCIHSASIFTISFPKTLLSYVQKKTGKDITQLIKEFTHYQLEWDDEDDCLVIPFNAIHGLFKPVISKLIMFIKLALKDADCQHIKKIILVGGFAASEILFEEVKEEFSPSIKVLRSTNPILAVLKGAIIYGRDHNMIKSKGNN